VKHLLLPALLALTFLYACNAGPAPGTGAPDKTAVAPATPPALSAADALLHKALEAHGGNRYDTADYTFVFRDKIYTFKNDGPTYRYTRAYEKDGKAILDLLDNGTFTRATDGKATPLSAKATRAASDGINSVVYFATLPHKLRDAAVNRYPAGETTIRGKKYQTLKVNFDEEGGGTDHDDNFLYWINDATGRIDYLAYDYRVNGGGVRMREAYNPRVVDGILFQDYVNYKAPVGTPLTALPGLLETGALKELSRIETEDVVRN